DTDTEFASGVLDLSQIVDSGAAAYVKIDQRRHCNWNPPSTVQHDWHDADDLKTYAEGYDAWWTQSSTGNTPEQRTSNYKLNIPGDAEVVGVCVSAYTANDSDGLTYYLHSVRITTVGPGGPIRQARNTKNYITGGSWHQYWWGSEGSLWGGELSSNPAEYNNASTEVAYGTTIRSNRHAYLNRLYLKVCYYHKGARYTTAAVSLPADCIAWARIEGADTVPAGTSLRYDVLHADTEAVLLSDQSLPVDLQGLGTSPLKVKAKMSTNDYTTSPSLQTLRLMCWGRP
ncbi:MAG: hypothetical protein JXR96_06525, partial [Deltaproteobacteria bacterium]|nr:hypothetical protein [Deltaproteobacteria bacterium]